MLVTISLLNQLLNRGFDLLLLPFRALDPLWPLLFVSMLTGLLMIGIFSKVSDQTAIRRIKNRVRGNLLGVRLFQHDLRVVLGLQKRLLLDTTRYLRYNLFPVVVLLVPVVLIVIQLHCNFGVAPLRPGQSVVVEARLTEADILSEEFVLEVPSQFRVETPAVRIPSKKEVSWRIRAAGQPGLYQFRVRVGSQIVGKEILVRDGWSRVSSLRTNSPWDLFLYPGEPPLQESGPFGAIQVRYNSLPVRLGGWDIHWLGLFFVASILSGFLLKGFFGVEF